MRSNFSFDIAKNILKRVQGSSESAGSKIEDDESQPPKVDGSDKEEIIFKRGFRESLELLQGIGEDEALRLAHVYEDVLGALHPIIDFTLLRNHIRDIF